MSTQAQTVDAIKQETRIVHYEATPGTLIALCGYVSQFEPYCTDDSVECVVCIDLEESAA